MSRLKLALTGRTTLRFSQPGRGVVLWCPQRRSSPVEFRRHVCVDVVFVNPLIMASCPALAFDPILDLWRLCSTRSGDSPVHQILHFIKEP